MRRMISDLMQRQIKALLESASTDANGNVEIGKRLTVDGDIRVKDFDDYKNTGNATALKAELAAIVADCNKVNTLSIEADTSMVLFHADIRPWLLKLRHTATVLTQLIDVAAMPAGNAKAQAYAQAAAEAKSLTYGAEFNIVALEGMAEGIGKQDYNARLGNKHLTPFVEYMLKKAK